MIPTAVRLACCQTSTSRKPRNHQPFAPRPMSWISDEKRKLAFASVDRVSYAVVVEVWVRKDANLTPEAIAMIRALVTGEDYAG